MNLKNKIEWLDGGATWNPVVGCLHHCEFCYARRMAQRFGKHCAGTEQRIHVLNEPEYKEKLHYDNGYASVIASITPPEIEYRQSPYPFGFDPTFHRYRLEEPQLKKQPQNIFVCSMADLFGDWVPYEWLDKVFDVCNGAPQHRYLFLTKNPKRYMELFNKLPRGNNFWFGTSVTTEDTEYWYSDSRNWFLSIEPIMSNFSGKGISGQVPLWDGPGLKPHWVIVGAETGNRKGKVIPKREWIENIVNECRRSKVPVFLKNSLAPIWREPLIQEYPW